MDRDYVDYIQRRLESNDGELLKELLKLAETLAAKMELPRHIDPKDTAHDVMVALIESLRAGKFRGESSIRTFAYRITINICLAKSRELKKAEFADIEIDLLASDGFSPDKDLMSREQRQLAARVVRSLPPRCRALWRMIFWGKQSYRQIAESLGVKEVTVRERMSSCRKKARELVKEYEI